MLVYSTEAEGARALLLRRYNTLDIFVEDTASQNIYIRVVNRILDRQGRITHVFALGGRDHVIAACKKAEPEQNKRRLYIIDADLDLIRGRRQQRINSLHTLSAYCIENLLLSEDAIAEIGAECAVNSSLDDVKSLLEIRSLLKSSAELLSPLFLIYAVCAELKLGVETVSFSVVRLLESAHDPSTLSQLKIQRRIRSILLEVLRQGKQREYREVRDRIQARLGTSGLLAADYVSGKTYLLPLVHLQLKGKVAFTDKVDRLKVRLAAHYDVGRDILLAQRIREIAAQAQT